MLTKISIDNLKCFKELSLPLAPLTVLTGFNAAGKSTSVQSLLLLAQSLRQRENEWVMPLNGNLVQLGTPGEALHEGAASSIALGIGAGESSLTWHLKADRGGQAHSMAIENIEWTSSEKKGIFPSSDGYSDVMQAVVKEASFQEIIETITNVVFISAVRAGTDDVYPIPSNPVPICADVGVKGEFAAWWFEQTADDEVDVERMHPSEEAKTIRRQLNAWASSLFPGAQANSTRVPGTQLVQLTWRNHETDSWRRPSNIGYGLTYAFPILVAGLLAKKGQAIIVDSPEAHLHPMGQSNMGRFLAVIATAGVQVIIETHSDHVLNGIRRAVFEKLLSPSKAAIHFFNSRPRLPDDSAHVVSPRLDQNGSVSEWPKGFFDQAENDMAILAGWAT